VNLARALYFDSDIVLMDDPLSAVDAHVSKYLFHECIQTAMRGKTRVLVTHQLQYAPQADYIVFLKEGRVHERGNFDTLMAQASGEFAHLFRTYGGGDNSADDKGSEEEQAAAAAAAAGEDVQGTEKKQEAAELAAEAVAAGGDASKPGAAAAGVKAPRALMTTEERAQGGLGLGVWVYYFKAFGGVPWVSLILSSVALQTGIRIFNDYCQLHTCLFFLLLFFSS
jgi:ABC-type proline/glycine betaine transport system ATPase subunit